MKLCRIGIGGVVLLSASTLLARGVTFDDRVRAQEAIERVYYAHQLSASRPFDEAVPAKVVREKVTRALKLSVALERTWKTPVTAAMLDAEVARMRAHTRMPGRLRELFAALDDDPVLIRECLARPALVERLARSFFASAPPPGAGTWDAWWASVAPSLDPAQLVVDASAPATTDVSVTASCPAPNSWDPGSLDDGPDTRLLATAVWTGSRMIVWGGKRQGRVLGNGFSYDPATDTWDAVTTIGAPSARSNHIAVWTGSRMIVWGGERPSGTSTPIYMSTGAAYDPVADTWTPVTETGAPSARSNAAAVWTGTEMILWGGGAAAGSYGDGARYDPATDQWSPMSAANAPEPRRNHTAVWTGTEMIVWGGYGSGDSAPAIKTGGRYDPATDTWTPTDSTKAPLARAYHSAVWDGGRMIVWGGLSTRLHGDGGAYDPRHDRWKPLSATGAPAPRYGQTAVWTGSRMLIWGGIGGGSVFLDSGGRYDPASDTWETTSGAGAPEGRYHHTAVWTGTEMIVWGGVDSGLELGTGGRYDPVTDTWTPTAMPRGPAPRSDAVSVWTGSLFLVWGGWDGAPRGDGGAYDPALDTWTLMTNAGAPSPRREHTAVWTGERFIVWGGDLGTTAATPTSTGAAYDPIADAWTPTSDIGAPSPRLAHTAVWTGKAMVVWGGDVVATGAGSPLDTGGRYDPATDTWTPTATTGAPMPRSHHVAVWTGREMLVFGGDAYGTVRHGGRYDPAKDAWHLMTLSGAPTGISGVPGVWTGTYLVVWNGFGTSTSQQGGRYDPSQDAWLPTAPAPTGNHRSTYAAAWTGREMVIWGGDDADSGLTLGDGARYDPELDTWQPMTLAGAPQPRAGHVMAMCGDDLVVWGGREAVAGSTVQSYDGDGSRFVLDRNGDGISDACDPDDDGDGVPDAQDCAPGDPTVASPPAPIVDVRIDGTTLYWSAQDPGTTYDVASDDLGDLRVTGTSEATCFASYLTQAWVDPLPDPIQWHGTYYLVRAVNVCGNSGWGEPGKPDRDVTACP